MIAPCPAFPTDARFVESVMAFVDCQAQAIGQGGYRALAAPGSSVALAITALLTIFVALHGYRMLFGQVPTVREAVLALVKIGVVLTLAGSWPAYRVLVYDVMLRAPAELAGAIGAPSALPGAGGGLVARLQAVDDALVELDYVGPGQPAPAEALEVPRQRTDPARDGKALGQARTLYLTGAIGSLAATRLVAGLLLALAPLFAGFLLFAATRGLFIGWIRVLAGAALGALAAAIVLGVELALLEPWLASTLTARYADIAMPGIPIQLLAVTLVFGLVLIAAIIAVARVAAGLRLPEGWAGSLERMIPGVGNRYDARSAMPDVIPRPVASPTRAAIVADAVVAMQRRETGAGAGTATLPGTGTRTPAPTQRGDAAIPPIVPLGQSFRRRTRGRASVGMQRRDMGS